MDNMLVTVNGEQEELAPGSVADLLARRGNEAARVVVELNGRILAREDFAQTCLQAGDRLEIVQFVGGG